MEHSYRRTVAGLAALKDGKSGLSLPFRRMLCVIEEDTEFAVIRASMAACRDQQIAAWLEQLETLGFVESSNACEDSKLEFFVLAREQYAAK